MFKKLIFLNISGIVSGDRKKSSEWTNLAKIRDFGLPEGVLRYVERLNSFIAKSINFKDFVKIFTFFKKN